VTGGSGAGRDFAVLVLCTANICRSPVAEAHLRSELGPDADVAVSSAGLRARTGEPVWPAMAEAAGVPLAGFTARQVDRDLLRRADLVLTMTRAQRAAAVDLAPATLRRTFTLREFADLALLASWAGPLVAASPGRRLAGLTAAAPRFRARRLAGVHDDIEDPYGRDRVAYEQADAEVRRAAAVLATLVREPSTVETVLTQGDVRPAVGRSASRPFG
jgi:protein-tyrosine phosphatase